MVKVAVITGGSNGIGEAFSNKLKELGAKVIIFDTKRAKIYIKSIIK